MDERESFEQLANRYGAPRARNLLGALRLLTLYGEDEVRRRRWIGHTGLELIRRDLLLAGVAWPAPGEDRGAQGERPMASVYQPLGAYLARQPGPTHTLTFDEVEAILDRPLPPVAPTGRRWWTNNPGFSQADYGWLAAGWQVDSVDRGGQAVTFRKD